MNLDKTKNADAVEALKADAPQMTETYQKARRNLTLASGVLLAWEYVGVQVGDPNSSGCKQAAELPLGSMQVCLLNPEVLPQVILFIVAYFAVRLWIEWSQCDLWRRTQIPCLADYGGALFLAVIAVFLFLIQKFSGLRVASGENPEKMVLLFCCGAGLVFISYDNWNEMLILPHSYGHVTGLLIVIPTTIYLLAASPSWYNAFPLLVGVIFSSAVIIIGRSIRRRHGHK